MRHGTHDRSRDVEKKDIFYFYFFEVLNFLFSFSFFLRRGVFYLIRNSNTAVSVSNL